MDEPVSAADANRRFSHLLRAVREDHASYVVTSHGKPVARIVPFDAGIDVSAHARDALLSRLGGQEVGNAGAWTREELYEDAR